MVWRLPVSDRAPFYAHPSRGRGDPAKVRQLLGPECGQLTATLLEWPEAALPPKLANKLREQGLFVGEAPVQGAKLK